jgi:hypothetical protein
MAERTADVQAHWTRPGVLARIDAALTEQGHDPQNLSPEILATLEHLHSGGLATTRDQAKRIALTEDSRVLDVGCGIGGPARYLAHTYGCRVDGIDLTPELIETARVLTCLIPTRPSTWFGAKTSARISRTRLGSSRGTGAINQRSSNETNGRLFPHGFYRAQQSPVKS